MSSDAIKKKTNLHPLCCSGREGFQEPKSKAVFSHDVELDKDALLCFCQFAQNRIEGGRAIDQKIEFVSAQKLLSCYRREITYP